MELWKSKKEIKHKKIKQWFYCTVLNERRNTVSVVECDAFIKFLNISKFVFINTMYPWVNWVSVVGNEVFV